MEWGAEPVGYTDQVGVTQWATIGPKSSWPTWAIVPDGVTLTVRANFQPAPGHDATGYGEISGGASARSVTQKYADALRRSGWATRIVRFDTRVPDENIHWCIVEGRRGSRVQRIRVDIDETRTNGQLSWADGAMPFPLGAKYEPCWAT